MAFSFPGATQDCFPLYGGTFARSYSVLKSAVSLETSIGDHDDRTTRSLVGTR